MPAAQHHLEEALAKSEGLNSLYMHYKITSDLSRVYIAQKQLVQADQLLDPIISSDPPKRTLAQRLIWTAQAELKLAQNRPDAALIILEQLIANAGNLTEETVIPRLWYLRGRALLALQRYEEATTILQAATAGAQVWDDQLNKRRSLIELGKLYLKLGKRSEAKEAFERARVSIEQLRVKLPAGKLSEHFSQQVMHDLPQSMLLSPKKVNQRDLNGLTQRELEVAKFVAQGKSNRAIADALILSERTIEKHVENIMAKLDVSSRAQIAVWIATKNIHEPPH